jgi:hypothetical protein
MPVNYRSSEWSNISAGHVIDLEKILLQALNSNDHAIFISFPEKPGSKTFMIADLTWILDREGGGNGELDAKDSTSFLAGETKKILTGETALQHGTSWPQIFSAMKNMIESEALLLGTTYVQARSEDI